MAPNEYQRPQPLTAPRVSCEYTRVNPQNALAHAHPKEERTITCHLEDTQITE
jgi:hypothetical protein